MAAIKAPGFGERRKRILEDIAVVSAGQVFLSDWCSSLFDATKEMLGTADMVKITSDSTLVVGGAGNEPEIRGRIAEIEKEIQFAYSDFDIDKLNERKLALESALPGFSGNLT